MSVVKQFVRAYRIFDVTCIIRRVSDPSWFPTADQGSFRPDLYNVEYRDHGAIAFDQPIQRGGKAADRLFSLTTFDKRTHFNQTVQCFRQIRLTLAYSFELIRSALSKYS